MYACWKPAAAAAVTGLASERERVGRRADWTLTESETEREVDGREEEGGGSGKGRNHGRKRKRRIAGVADGGTEKEIEDARGVVYVYTADT